MYVFQHWLYWHLSHLPLSFNFMLGKFSEHLVSVRDWFPQGVLKYANAEIHGEPGQQRT